VSEGFEIETEIFVKAHRAGFCVTEVPSYESGRTNGVSNLNPLRDGWRILRTLIRWRFSGGLGAPRDEEVGEDVVGVPAGSDGFK
jgi:hypothetical protein